MSPSHPSTHYPELVAPIPKRSFDFDRFYSPKLQKLVETPWVENGLDLTPYYAAALGVSLAELGITDPDSGNTPAQDYEEARNPPRPKMLPAKVRPRLPTPPAPFWMSQEEVGRVRRMGGRPGVPRLVPKPEPASLNNAQQYYDPYLPPVSCGDPLLHDQPLRGTVHPNSQQASRRPSVAPNETLPQNTPILISNELRCERPRPIRPFGPARIQNMGNQSYHPASLPAEVPANEIPTRKAPKPQIDPVPNFDPFWFGKHSPELERIGTVKDPKRGRDVIPRTGLPYMYPSSVRRCEYISRRPHPPARSATFEGFLNYEPGYRNEARAMTFPIPSHPVPGDRWANPVFAKREAQGKRQKERSRTWSVPLPAMRGKKTGKMPLIGPPEQIDTRRSRTFPMSSKPKGGYWNLMNHDQGKTYQRPDKGKKPMGLLRSVKTFIAEC